VIATEPGVGLRSIREKAGRILWQYRAGLGGRRRNRMGLAVDVEHAVLSGFDITRRQPGGCMP